MKTKKIMQTNELHKNHDQPKTPNIFIIEKRVRTKQKNLSRNRKK